VPPLLLEQAGLVAPAAHRKLSGNTNSSVPGVSTVGAMASALSSSQPAPAKSATGASSSGGPPKFSDQWLPSEVALNIRLGDLFLEFGAFFKMYSQYAIGHHQATELLTTLTSDHKYAKFQSWLAEQQSDSTCRGHSIHSLLIQPIQRIPRYQLLMKELLKYTPEGHPDYGVATFASSFLVSYSNGMCL
jgi:hypothetical protein